LCFSLTRQVSPCLSFLNFLSSYYGVWKTHSPASVSSLLDSKPTLLNHCIAVCRPQLVLKFLKMLKFLIVLKYLVKQVSPENHTSVISRDLPQIFDPSHLVFQISKTCSAPYQEVHEPPQSISPLVGLDCQLPQLLPPSALHNVAASTSPSLSDKCAIRLEQ